MLYSHLLIAPSPSIFAVHFRAKIIGTALHIDMVLPCYNPAAGWVDTVIERFARLRSGLPGDQLQLYIVNDGSTRGVSQKDVQKLQSAVPDMVWLSYTENRGKGFALRHGIGQTASPFVVYTDIDLPYTNASMIAVVEALRGGANLAAGSRDADYYQKIPASRKWISRMLKGFNGRVFGLRVPDTQCGLKGVDARGRKILLETTIDRYLFDLEFIMQASRLRTLRIEPVPVYLEPGVELSPVNPGLLIKEVGNLARLFVKRWF